MNWRQAICPFKTTSSLITTKSASSYHLFREPFESYLTPDGLLISQQCLIPLQVIFLIQCFPSPRLVATILNDLCENEHRSEFELDSPMSPSESLANTLSTHPIQGGF